MSKDIYKRFDAQDEKLNKILENQYKLIEMLKGEEPQPDIEELMPYPIENAKLTWPDASESFYPDYLNRDSDVFRVNPDGSIYFRVVKSGTTPNTKYSRCEFRWMKSPDDKKNWNWHVGEMLSMRYGVKMHSVWGKDTTVVSQVHGEKDPYFKIAIGKGQVRALCKTREGLTKDDEVIVLYDDAVPDKDYIIDWIFNGHNLSIRDATGSWNTVVFVREDSYYPKAGCYGKAPAECTHFKI